ncbi:uncharacterized protein LOC117939651 isoform X3 [Etheostoma cragini]|uniref:uncharacterized protein LOC117939651 isoform X3 n=1 Tax=Etheostoma cragini TaxID=417921 RepID=UPI00155F0D0C|nr:uncharacterized protein LOC117939651 isoform X3 [Etheostoma cragini]
MESHIHMSVFKKNNIPQLTRCTVCCTKYHCPLCPPSMYKARSRAKVLQHMEVHVNNAIRHEDFFITKCHQACRSGSSGHFHCPFCCKTTIKRQDTMRHLQICRPPLLHARLDADADVRQKDITSQTEECKAEPSNPPHLSNDKLPETVHDCEMQGPDHPAEGPQDPSSDSVLLSSPRLDNPPCRVPRAKHPNILCPHCDVQLLRKNFKKHLYRKHPDKSVGDMAADVNERSEKYAVKNSFLGPLLSLDLQKETWGKEPQIKCESSECQVSELGIAAAWSLSSHVCAYPPVHISVIKKNNIPRSTRCTVCCTKYHCPLCPPSMYKARNRAKVLQHMEVHIKNAIRHQDFFITKCHHACRSGSSGHFHCPFCCKTTIKRQDTMRHLQICRPPLLDAQLDADADVRQKDITSQTEECKEPSNPPHLSNDKLPETVLDSEMPGPEDTAERPQDPSPEPVLLFNSRVKPPTILCPHCNVQLQRKNLKKHLYRKHSENAVGDVAANSPADAVERNEKDAVKESILGPLLQLDLQKETWGKGPQSKCESSECQVSEAGMAAAWSLPSHDCTYPTVQDCEMQGPGDPAEGPEDPSPESVSLSSPLLENPPCRVPRAKPPNILCPHCNVQLLRKNLKMHIYRKHPDKAVEDIAANSDLNAECIDERNGKTKRKPGAKRTKSSGSPGSANRPGRKRKASKLD